ncbi:hypothetical protein LSH36_521g01075 [Paralvinella palmiformis]|uniref:Leucine-rich repeat-containing protein 71 n=1 Tax=Paralvinella palmiformis TaxID=53620 RepID=A0AAD9J8P2_9ANNE|nr:hypothetical protein LSH36_521g01075 [Paralvinella palmiformis]
MSDGTGKVTFTSISSAFSFAKKVKMGKKLDRVLGRDKTSSSATGDSRDDDPNRTPEPYLCTGHFQTDFTDLCHRNQMIVVPSVVLRPHRPPSPFAAPTQEEKTKPGKKDDKKNVPPPEPEPEPSVDDNGEPPEPPPKTYLVKEKFEYFKPTVQVEMDNPDKLDTVTEVYIRGWKVDVMMMNIFKQCWPKMDRLHTISLWYTGLNEESLDILSQFIPECVNLRNLILDNNPVKNEAWHTLIKDDSPVQNLSLRYNNISDLGAANLGKALGTVAQQNQKLISLNLNGNHIGNDGAEALAGGLRLNRTLLSLGIAHNEIGNKGAQKLAEVISRFPLTHEEIVERRKLLSTAPDRKSVSTLDRKARRRLEHSSSNHSLGSASSPPKGKAGQDLRSKNAMESPQKGRASSEISGSTENLDPTPGGKRADSRDRPGSVRSYHGAGGAKGKSAKTKKDGKGGKEDDKAKGKKQEEKPPKKGVFIERLIKVAAPPVVVDLESTDSNEPQSPLLDKIEVLKDGVILLKGNMNLISLNVSYNQIDEEGAKKILAAHNKIPSNSEILNKLNDLMHSKDPFYKPQIGSPDQGSQQMLFSKNGRCHRRLPERTKIC